MYDDWELDWWRPQYGGSIMTRTKNPSLPDDRLEQWMICKEPIAGKYANEPNPKKLYDSEKVARHDAEILCVQNGIPFYLLKVIAIVSPQRPPTEWTEE